jgi:hypothetical protein
MCYLRFPTSRTKRKRASLTDVQLFRLLIGVTAIASIDIAASALLTVIVAFRHDEPRSGDWDGTDEEGKCNKLRGWQIRGPEYWQVCLSPLKPDSGYRLQFPFAEICNFLLGGGASIVWLCS